MGFIKIFGKPLDAVKLCQLPELGIILPELTILVLRLKTEVKWFDAGEVAAEVEKAYELERQMKKEALKQLRDEKKEDFKQKVEDQRKKISEEFDNLKKKLS